MISDARRRRGRTAIMALGASAATGLLMPGTAAAAPDPCRIHATAQRLVVSLDNAGDARAEQMRAELARLDEVAGADPPASCGSADAAQERPYFAAADWLWDPIPADPELDQQSAEMVSHLADGDHIANTGEFGVTLLGPDGIDDGTPRYSIPFSADWGPDPFGDATMPIPDGTAIAPGSDSQLAVADPVSGQVYNLWQAAESGGGASSGGWSAAWGAMTPLDGDGRETDGSSTGSGIARFAAVIRADEIAAGEIPHALFFSTNAAAPEEFRFPPTKTDGSNMDGVGAPILDFWTESSGEMSGITVVGNAFSGNGRGAITVNGGSFPGTNVIRDNLFTDGDSAPDGLPGGFTTGDTASGGEPQRENRETP